jgi:adenylate kinase
MRLLMVAPPGAGKGTQATRLATHYQIAHLSSGDLFRKEVAAGTEIGRIAADYLSLGDLVPDELVIEMLTEPVLEAVRNGGYVLDGFPRTLRQAEEAYRAAEQVEGIELQAVVHLEVSAGELHRRLVARAELQGRSDDTEVTIAHRLEVFDAERGLVVSVNGEQAVDQVFNDIVTAVDSLRAGRR